MTDPTTTPPPVDPTPPSMPAPAAPAAPAPTPAAPAPSASAAPTSMTAARPTGITILAILGGLEGVFGLLGGFTLLFAGSVGAGTGGSLLGIALLALAALALAFGWGAWSLQPWAWPLGVAFAAYGVVINLLQIVGGNAAGAIIGLIIAGGVLYYLNQPTIKSLFGRA
jgi:hypothetical protein